MESSSLSGANGIESIHILSTYDGIVSSLQQLCWYGFVNHEKILDKLAKFSNTSLTNDEWQVLSQRIIEQQARYSRHVDVLLQRLSTMSGNEKSLCLTSLLPSLLQRRYSKNLRGHVEKAILAVQADDTRMLENAIQGMAETQALRQDDGHLYGELLFHCIILHSCSCLEYLLQLLSDCSKQLAWLIIKVGSIVYAKLHGSKVVKNSVATIDIPGITEVLLHVIRRMADQERAALFHRDHCGRLPLHYAVQYRLEEVSMCILEQMTHGGSAVESANIMPALIEDEEAAYPLKLAVLAGDAPITEYLLLSVGKLSVLSDSWLGELTVLSIRLGSLTVLQLLLSAGSDVTFSSYNHESALYVAIKYGWNEAIASILGAMKQQAPTAIDLPEAVRGWTPLMLACVKGDKSTMHLLLQHGADTERKDKYGWTAKDHAAYRGWESMALLLSSLELRSTKERDHSPLRDGPQRQGKFRRTVPLHSWRRHLLDDIAVNLSQVYVTLGAIDTYIPIKAVDLGPYLSPMPYGPQEEAKFTVEVTSLVTGQPKYTVQLPIMEDLSNDPLCFTTPDPENLHLAFNIYPANSSTRNNDSMIGSAIAMTQHLKQGLGPKRESLIRNFTVPILEKATLAYIGSVTFYLLVVTPCPHAPERPRSKQEMSFTDKGDYTIIGHRGRHICSI